MKPLLKIIDTKQNQAFQIMIVHDPYFFPSWHFHPEYEIMLVQEGTGMRFVGDSMERFQAGDMVFYGPNIPHLYRSDREYYQRDSKLLSRATVIYFKESFLGNGFWDVPDLAPIKTLFSHAKRGMRFQGKTKEELSLHMRRLVQQEDGIERITSLLRMLNMMAHTKEYDMLSSSGFTKYIDEKDCERINKVYQFIMDNYALNPSLDDASRIASMSTTAFCRYFKSRTNKTYTQFVNEVKVGNACKLLLDNKLSISQVCFEIGFNNFTHFNNQFKKIIGLTPRQYQEKHFQNNPHSA